MKLKYHFMCITWCTPRMVFKTDGIYAWDEFHRVLSNTDMIYVTVLR